MNHVGRHAGFGARRGLPLASGFNPADVSGPDLVLDSFNQRVSQPVAPVAFETIRGLTSHSSGKFYFEMYAGPASTNRVEVGVMGTAALSGGPSQSAGGVATIPSGLGSINGSGSIGVGAWNDPNMAWDNGIVCRVAVNVTSRLAWFLPINGLAPGWNNFGGSDPNGTGGVSINGASALFIAGGIITLSGDAVPKSFYVNTGDLGFVGAVPSGYLPWG